MESPKGEKLVEISLESVLRKASELEESLRGCKTRVEDSLSASTASRGRSSSLTKGPPLTRTHSQPLPMEEVRYGPPPASRELTDQWQKLTAYIVSLEKEVQYYKQLLQDVRLHQNTDNRGTLLEGCPTGHSSTTEKEPAMDKLLDEEPENRVLLLVFAYLSPEELCPVALVCRKWCRLTRQPQFWREVVISETAIKPEVSQQTDMQ
jgi:hypothetical protein